MTSGGRGRGGDVPRGHGDHGGIDGRGVGVDGRTATSATLATESAMAARIEQLEQRFTAMAGPGASNSKSYKREDFSYLASAAQVDASVAVIRGGARASESHRPTMELDP